MCNSHFLPTQNNHGSHFYQVPGVKLEQPTVYQKQRQRIQCELCPTVTASTGCWLWAKRGPGFWVALVWLAVQSRSSRWTGWWLKAPNSSKADTIISPVYSHSPAAPHVSFLCYVLIFFLIFCSARYRSVNWVYNICIYLCIVHCVLYSVSCDCILAVFHFVKLIFDAHGIDFLLWFLKSQFWL